MKKITALSGSLRANSSNENILKAIAGMASQLEIQIFKGIDKISFFNPDQAGPELPEKAREFRSLIANSEGLIISSPEYAHGIPGVLKNALDWLVGDERFEGKPIVLICTGQFAPFQLEETLKTMSAKILAKHVLTAPELRRAVDHSGSFVDKGLENEIRKSLSLLINS